MAITRNLTELHTLQQPAPLPRPAVARLDLKRLAAEVAFMVTLLAVVGALMVLRVVSTTPGLTLL